MLLDKLLKENDMSQADLAKATVKMQQLLIDGLKIPELLPGIMQLR